jgi:excisionase family DNA binding protein
VFLTVEETAAFLRVGKKVIYSAIKAGTFPGVVRLSPRVIRIRKDALEGTALKSIILASTSPKAH